MEKAVSGNVTNYVDRRLHPVRLSIGHLNRLLESTRSGGSMSVSRDLIFSITSTLEIFLEDFERECLASSGKEEKKLVDSKAGESPRITQTRVS